MLSFLFLQRLVSYQKDRHKSSSFLSFIEFASLKPLPIELSKYLLIRCLWYIYLKMKLLGHTIGRCINSLETVIFFLSKWLYHFILPYLPHILYILINNGIISLNFKHSNGCTLFFYLVYQNNILILLKKTK